MELLAQAEAHARDSGERWYEAELHRLRGTIVQSREPRTAEAHFQRAIDVARAQGAKLWELRATVDLATMLRQEKKQEAARHVLQPVLSWLQTMSTRSTCRQRENCTHDSRDVPHSNDHHQQA
jgi:predicted ATPase